MQGVPACEVGLPGLYRPGVETILPTILGHIVGSCTRETIARILNALSRAELTRMIKE